VNIKSGEIGDSAYAFSRKEEQQKSTFQYLYIFLVVCTRKRYQSVVYLFLFTSDFSSFCLVHPVLFLGRGPLGSNLSTLSEELDSTVTGDVHVTELATVEATKGERLTRNGHANVHTEHTGSEALSEPLSNCTAGGVDGGGISEGRTVLQLNGLFLGAHLQDANNGAKDLLLKSGIVAVLVNNHGGTNPESLLELLGNVGVLLLDPLSTVNENLSATLLCLIDVLKLK
jgi:hypothetical protein